MLHLHHQPPTLTTQQALSLASKLYGIQAVAARLLPGEYDQNFALTMGDGREAFVLKVAHAGEQQDVLDLQNSALEYLAKHAPELRVQRIQRTLQGEPMASITGVEGETHLVRMLTYLPGKVLAQTRPHTPELLHALGEALGELDRTLQGLSHPAARRDLKWDMLRAGWIRDYVQHISHPERRALVGRLLAAFEADTLPVLPTLRSSIIHNDANDYNVLVERDAQRKVAVSLLDFGDMLQTATICELAIACAYAMLDKPDPVSAAAHVVAGYHTALPLTEAELEVLFPLICTRLCVSVTNSAYRQSLRPDDEYVTISEQPAWTLLEKLAMVPPSLAHFTFRHACGLSPSPTSEAVVEWLRLHPEQIGRVVAQDLKTTKTLVFDLSIGSTEVGNQADLGDTEAFTFKLFSRMRAAKAVVGVGRYNEARPIYTSEMFQVESNDGPEWRTIHIALDVFQEAGSPISAPLDGVVHSFQNNTAPLDYGPTIILQHTVDGGALTFYTLYGHLSEDSLDGLYVGKPIQRGARIARIGNYPINGNWPPHLHFQIITDLLGRVGEFPGVARPSQRDIWLSISPDPNVIVGLPESAFPPAPMNAGEILERRAAQIGPSLSISYRKPLHIVRGSMQYLYDMDGRKYLDAVNNVPHVGHSHPRVVRAAQEQMEVLNTNTRYLHEHLVRYAERLCATLPEPLRVCYFVCSGSEANELALRLARTHTRQKDTVVVDVAYHGNTSSLVEISPYKFNGPGGSGAPPYVHVVPMPDVYRGAYKQDDPSAGEKYARYVAEAIKQFQAEGRGVGAFICESLLGCGGQIVLPDGYLQAAYRHARAAGGVCIADEVQTGFGRVGTHFWGFETQGVVPDIVTMGKPIGNGHPLGAVVTTPEIAASFNNGMEYFNTFGGNPVSCAIGMTVLDVIEEERLQTQALHVGTHLLDGLRGLMAKHPVVGDVRGLGLFLGIELVKNRTPLEPATQEAAYVANRMRECGILLSTDGPFHNVLKIKPPLVFNEANADFLVATLDRVLAEDEARGTL
jgi:4-aminobutyrate aminotransferase-like enzyme/Ser/Thr protein kinase RdoA (MazF antagonist)